MQYYHCEQGTCVGRVQPRKAKTVSFDAASSDAERPPLSVLHHRHSSRASPSGAQAADTDMAGGHVRRRR